MPADIPAEQPAPVPGHDDGVRDFVDAYWDDEDDPHAPYAYPGVDPETGDFVWYGG